MTCINTKEDLSELTPREMADRLREMVTERAIEQDWRARPFPPCPPPPAPRDISCCLPPPKIKHRDPQIAKRAALRLLARVNMRLVRELARTNSARLRAKRKRRNTAADDQLLRKEQAAIQGYLSSLATVTRR